MVTYIQKIRDCDISALFSVYSQSLEEARTLHYLRLDANEGFLLASQDYYQYLSRVFFRTSGAILAVYSHNGKYVSALRLEPYQDGYLMNALETAPDCRGKGYGKHLVKEVITYCRAVGIQVLYSHVHKQNAVSKRLHIAAGFTVLSSNATLLDGTFSTQYETLCLFCK